VQNPALRLAVAATLVSFASASSVPHRHAAPTYEVYAIRFATVKSFPASGLISGADANRRLDIAMMVWLLKGSDGRNVLVDAGFYREKFLERWKPRDYKKPSDALAALGVKPSDISDIILSHVHWDHADGLDLFPKARIWVQKKEYEYYVDENGRVLHDAIDSVDARVLFHAKRDGRVQLVDGDAVEIIPGIKVYTGGRHTYESQYVGANTTAGTVIVASDNAYLYENLSRHIPIAQTFDSAANRQAMERMAKLASSDRLIVPGHDPEVFTRFPTPGNGVARIQ
jgi:glyoxylase-like metal-dependent hydrolase (beta-lactamase superfamily II)